MDLYKEILAHALFHNGVEVSFSGVQIDTAKIVESKCYQALRKIKDIIADDRYDDEKCFQRIEEIISTLEFWVVMAVLAMIFSHFYREHTTVGRDDLGAP